MKVKVCGITQKQDAIALEKLGVNYLGFIFHPKSKRFIAPIQAKEIISNLSQVKTVGVFVNETPQEINRIAQSIGLDLVQLHGHESQSTIKQITVPVMKVIHVVNHQIEDSTQYSCQFLLFDPQTKDAIGGTGTSFNLDILKQNPPNLPYFISGGLGPRNLKEVLQSCPKAYAVDLNSKVETSPRIKDLEKVKYCLSLMKNKQ